MSELEVNYRTFVDLLKPVLPHVCADDMLPALNSVHLQLTKENYLVASGTDRFTLGVSRTEDPLSDPDPTGPFDIIIPLPDVKQIITVFKPAPRMAHRAPTLTFRLEKDKIAVVVEDRHDDIVKALYRFDSYPLTQPGYPDLAAIVVKAVADKTTRARVANVNAKYLARFQHAVSDATPITVHSAAPRKPVVVTAGNHFIGAIMPVNAESPDPPISSSWDDLLKAEATV